MSEFQAKALRQFIDEGEKEAPPVFAGRDPILDDILTVSKRSWKPGNWFREDSHGLAGNTRIVHGAPGAGKSSILRRLEDWKMTPSEASGLPKIRPRILLLNSAEIVTPAGILKPLAELVCERRAREFNRQYDRSLSLGMGIGDISVSAKGESRPSQAHSMVGIEEFRTWIKSLPWHSRLRAPVIVAIDEAQRFDHDAGSPVARVLQALHDNAWSLPLTLVLAGLGDTPDKSRKMQLTRGTRLHEVGCLSGGETRQVMEGFCRTFGVPAEGFEDRLMAYAEPSEGWPRHLHFAQAVLGQELLKVHGDMQALDWNLLDTEFRESRTRYYQGQQSKPMHSLHGLTAAVMAQFRTGMNLEDIRELVEDNAKPGKGFDLENSLLEGKRDAYGLIEHLVHQGVLQEAGSGAFYSPIPSFRSFLIEQGSPDSWGASAIP
ncbi:MAG: ATP-binding protein [Gammaproteobacteria bacterium]|nr:ATP-binding protein [Gammaproteobacteria bacterium]